MPGADSPRAVVTGGAGFIGSHLSDRLLKDGWTVVKAIHGYMQDDPESANCAAVIQWVNPACPPPPEFALR